MKNCLLRFLSVHCKSGFFLHYLAPVDVAPNTSLDVGHPHGKTEAGVVAAWSRDSARDTFLGPKMESVDAPVGNRLYRMKFDWE
jgi:hypothetical protein